LRKNILGSGYDLVAVQVVPELISVEETALIESLEKENVEILELNHHSCSYGTLKINCSK
jgi:NADH:ubiquinone oxidoreductase subunit F (NADH-binding)